MAREHWEHFHHGADIGVRGFGPTLVEAFRQVALALIAVITEPHLVEAREKVSVTCQAADDELLLADWLNAIIYEMAHRRMLFSRFDLRITNHHLEAILWGEQVEVSRHEPAVEIKGATYTELNVRRTDDGDWLAQCVVDV